jgi:hypothetical protein
VVHGQNKVVGKVIVLGITCTKLEHAHLLDVLLIIFVLWTVIIVKVHQAPLHHVAVVHGQNKVVAKVIVLLVTCSNIEYAHLLDVLLIIFVLWTVHAQVVSQQQQLHKIIVRIVIMDVVIMRAVLHQLQQELRLQLQLPQHLHPAVPVHHLHPAVPVHLVAVQLLLQHQLHLFNR